LATAIYAGLTVFDLENLDLAYAPPFGSARDPVIVAGMIASNAIRQEGRIISPRQLDVLRKEEDITILDCRTKEEYAKGYIEGAIHMPVDELRNRYQEIDPDKKVVIYCRIGYRANIGFRFLLQKGFDVYNLTGGYASYTMSISG
ncbi:MAG TPA: rhodanese-like domain-containing protein, partial [Bacillota bacterium]|nr:rhodanese-like domain-containing protein [Bacillota bacterium]